MCDNIDTRRVLETLRELVVASNAYIEKTRVGEPGVNRHDIFFSSVAYFILLKLSCLYLLMMI